MKINWIYMNITPLIFVCCLQLPGTDEQLLYADSRLTVSAITGILILHLVFELF